MAPEAVEHKLAAILSADVVGSSVYGTTRGADPGAPLGPKQGLPYEEWLRAYTIGAARAGGQEDERGSLSPGKRADLVVVEGELDPERPPTVVETWVGGTAHRYGASG